MSCPVLCFTCGKILGNKYHHFLRLVIEEKKKNETITNVNEPSILNINADEIKLTPEGIVLNKLGLIRDCCRKIYLCNINLIDNI